MDGPVPGRVATRYTNTKGLEMTNKLLAAALVGCLATSPALAQWGGHHGGGGWHGHPGGFHGGFHPGSRPGWHGGGWHGGGFRHPGFRRWGGGWGGGGRWVAPAIGLGILGVGAAAAASQYGYGYPAYGYSACPAGYYLASDGVCYPAY